MEFDRYRETEWDDGMRQRSSSASSSSILATPPFLSWSSSGKEVNPPPLRLRQTNTPKNSNYYKKEHQMKRFAFCIIIITAWNWWCTVYWNFEDTIVNQHQHHRSSSNKDREDDNNYDDHRIGRIRKSAIKVTSDAPTLLEKIGGPTVLPFSSIPLQKEQVRQPREPIVLPSSSSSFSNPKWHSNFYQFQNRDNSTVDDATETTRTTPAAVPSPLSPRVLNLNDAIYYRTAKKNDDGSKRDTSPDSSLFYSFRVYTLIRNIAHHDQMNQQSTVVSRTTTPSYFEKAKPRTHHTDMHSLESHLYVNQIHNEDYKKDCIHYDPNGVHHNTSIVSVHDDGNWRNEQDGEGPNAEEPEWVPNRKRNYNNTTTPNPTQQRDGGPRVERRRSWQKANYPVCNTIHEIGLLGHETGYDPYHLWNIKLLGRGSWRATYSLQRFLVPTKTKARNRNRRNRQQQQPHHQKVESIVIKLFALGDDDDFPFDMAAYEMNRIDSIISSKMTASSNILNIYGYCGLSSLYERGIDDLQHRAKYRSPRRNKKEQDKYHIPLTLQQKFEFISQVIQAIYDLHTIDSNVGVRGGERLLDLQPTTIIHGDIKPENFVVVPNKYNDEEEDYDDDDNDEKQKRRKKKGRTTVLKLNDFNNSILCKSNRTAYAIAAAERDTGVESDAATPRLPSAPACPYYMNKVPVSWGAGYRPYEFSVEGYPPLNDNVDVFGLGSVLYYILEGKDPYEMYTMGQEELEIQQGILPPITSTTTKYFVSSPSLSSSSDKFTFNTNTNDYYKYNTKKKKNRNTETNTVIINNNNVRIDTNRIVSTILDIIYKSMSFNPKERPTIHYILDTFVNATLPDETAHPMTTTTTTTIEAATVTGLTTT